MKISALSVVLLLSAGVMSAQTPAPTTPAKPADVTIVDPSKAAPVDPKAAPAKAAPKKVEKKDEKIGKIAGITLNRPNGTFLGLEIVGVNFKLTFYDKKKKPMKIDVTRATAKWPNNKGPGDNYAVLNGGGTFLTSGKPALPPYNYIVFLNLLQGEGDDAKVVENYQVHLQG